MFCIGISSRLFALIPFAFCLSAFADGPDEKPSQVKFRARTDSMIIVPVTINGSGPFDFLLDTGGTGSVIDQRLAAELSLPLAGNINLTTHEGNMVTSLFHADSLSMAGATVRGLNLSAVNRRTYPVAEARGVLGEDFLRNFDLLIDYKHHLLQFESVPGPLADGLGGERLQLHRNGLYNGELTHNRLIVIGHIGLSGDKDLRLLLDSGTPIFLLFAIKKSTLFSQAPPSVSGIFGSSFEVDAQTALGLRLGRAIFSNLTVFTPAVSIPEHDVDGLLPTSLFRSIFISHSGEFVILNPSSKDPSVKPALAQLAPRSLPDSAISP
jgi:predicted aspartyl protease